MEVIFVILSWPQRRTLSLVFIVFRYFHLGYKYLYREAYSLHYCFVLNRLISWDLILSVERALIYLRCYNYFREYNIFLWKIVLPFLCDKFRIIKRIKWQGNCFKLSHWHENLICYGSLSHPQTLFSIYQYIVLIVFILDFLMAYQRKNIYSRVSTFI